MKLFVFRKATKINFTKAATGNSTHIYIWKIYFKENNSFWLWFLLETLNATQLENKLWYFPKSIKENLRGDNTSKKKPVSERYNLLDSIEEDIF